MMLFVCIPPNKSEQTTSILFQEVALTCQTPLFLKKDLQLLISLQLSLSTHPVRCDDDAFKTEES